jgi:uroporphyrinogen-III decarboxylase
MQSWAADHNSAWNHYFSYVSTNRATYDIRDGKVSPWLLLNSTSGKKLLGSLSDEQLASISTVIDPEVWLKKFKKQRADLDLVKEIVKEANL